MQVQSFNPAVRPVGKDNEDQIPWRSRIRARGTLNVTEEQPATEEDRKRWFGRAPTRVQAPMWRPRTAF